MEKIKIVILAAGLGKRMGNGDLPKALVPLKGKPMISYLLSAVAAASVDSRPVIVVGYMADTVKKVLGDNYIYVLQSEQLGTGHAVACARDSLKDYYENILVLYCDHPLVTPQTIKNLYSTHLKSGKVLTMATTTVPDFNAWRATFDNFGRVERDANGKILRIVEKKDASETQLAIKEVNPSYFCFKADWLWQNLSNLKNENVQKEYYLTDLVGLAVTQNQDIATIEIENQEALGANTVEQLNQLANFI